jgi:hypothetical protein
MLLDSLSRHCSTYCSTSYVLTRTAAFVAVEGMHRYFCSTVTDTLSYLLFGTIYDVLRVIMIPTHRTSIVMCQTQITVTAMTLQILAVTVTVLLQYDRDLAQQ